MLLLLLLLLLIRLAFEIPGAIGSESLVFLVRRLHQATGDALSFQFLMQRLSVAIQQGNAAACNGKYCPIAWYIVNAVTTSFGKAFFNGTTLSTVNLCCLSTAQCPLFDRNCVKDNSLILLT